MANEMKFTGKVTVITPEQCSADGAAKPWVKQTVIIQEEKDQYPQSIAIEAFNKADEVKKIQVGSTCDVYFNVSAKEYQGRYFGSNGLWKFDNVVGSEIITTVPSGTTPPTESPSDTTLPF